MLAWVYHTRRQYAGAEPLLIRALTILESSYGPAHNEVVAGMGMELLEHLYCYQNRHDQAEALYVRRSGA